jgi:uncharacterized membrane protein
METPASVHHHPLHTILVAIPIGLWLFSFTCDVAVAVSDSSDVANLWFTIAYYAMLGGFAGALLAAVPGLIDYAALPDGRLRKLAAKHMAINLVVVALYALNLWIRADEAAGFGVVMGLSALALCLLATSAWIGGELVHVHGVGVADATAARALRGRDAGGPEAGVTRMGRVPF